MRQDRLVVETDNGQYAFKEEFISQLQKVVRDYSTYAEVTLDEAMDTLLPGILSALERNLRTSVVNFT